MLCTQREGRREEGRNVWGDGVLSSQIHVMEPCPSGVAEHLGSGERIPCFTLLVQVAFAFLVELSLSQPMNFLTSTFLILSLIALVRGE